MQKLTELNLPRIFIDCLYVIRVGNLYWDSDSLVSLDSAIFFTNYALGIAEARRIPKDLKRSSGCQVHRINFPKFELVNSIV